MSKFRSFQLVGLNCPNFTGVQEHGQNLILNLDNELVNRFEAYCDGMPSCHVYQDGTIYITKMDYNPRAEEYQEEIIADLTNNRWFIDELDTWLKDNPLYRLKNFPYSVSTRPDFWGSDEICNSLDSLIEYLKKY